MKKLILRLRQAFRKEDGNASVEFALVVPVLLTIFTASFESGFVMLRLNLLQHGLDVTMRELRLGKMPNANQTMIKQKICNNMTMVDSCMDNLLVEVTPLSNWVMPSTKTTCLDLQTKIVPVVQLNIGQQNQLMLVRACLVQDMIFPTTGLGMSLPKNYDGDFNLIAASAYVNEPN
jgi:Flp pilus assembly protein TadG